MKISLSRRQRAFFAKWGGVVIATILIIPISVFGGTFLLANSRIDNTLNYVAQAVNLLEFFYVGNTPELPPDYVYHLKLIIQNDTPELAEVSIANALITIDEFTYNITGSAGWSGRIEARDILIFEGDITVKREQLKSLADKMVPVQISGIITVKSRYGFIEKTETSLIQRPAKAKLPPPSTVVPSEIPPSTTIP